MPPDANTFAFGHAAPNAVLDAVRECVLETLAAYGAVAASTLRGLDPAPVGRKELARARAPTARVDHPCVRPAHILGHAVLRVHFERLLVIIHEVTARCFARRSDSTRVLRHPESHDCCARRRDGAAALGRPPVTRPRTTRRLRRRKARNVLRSFHERPTGRDDARVGARESVRLRIRLSSSGVVRRLRGRRRRGSTRWLRPR